MTILPENILNKLSPEDRKSLGKAGVTKSEAEQKHALKKEKDDHDLFSKWLRLNNIPFINSRMDKRSTIRSGWPDFTIFQAGKALLIEMKVEGRKLRDDQEQCANELRLAGMTVHVTYSAQEAIEKTKNWIQQ